jgi:hypothetical protein
MLRCQEDLSLDAVKQKVIQTVRQNETLWTATYDLDEFEKMILNAKDFAHLLESFR